MAVGSWLADKSALVRIAASPDAELWMSRIQRGLVHVCSITRLEVAYSGRNAADISREFTSGPMSRLLMQYFTPAIEDRAFQVLQLLAERGQHRGPGLGDLLIAAVAESNNLTVLHVDSDFDTIADVTGQPMERLRLSAPKVQE